MTQVTMGSGEAAAVPSAESQGALQTPGLLLEQERVRRGLSVQQAAEALHLDAWIIEAIESNRFLALGAPVYAKGYLRKYAVMLGLAPEVIVARYDALSDTLPEPTPIPVITTTPPPRPKWPKLVGWSVLSALIVAIGLLAYRFLMPGLSSAVVESQTAVSPDLSAPSQAPDQGTQSAAVPVAESPAVESPAVESSERPVAEVPQPQEAVPVAVHQPAAVAQSSASDAATVRLTLQFNGSSWTEVYDAAGQRLFYDIGQPGRSRVLSGAAPLNVVIGVASAVSVQVNDQAIVVPRRANRDSSRFVVHADGSVR